MHEPQLDTPAGSTTLTAENDNIDILESQCLVVTAVRACQDLPATERLVRQRNGFHGSSLEPTRRAGQGLRSHRRTGWLFIHCRRMAFRYWNHGNR